MSDIKTFNIVAIISHDIGRRFGSYGNHEVSTPNIDRFAETAFRFDAHYCQWPLCGPSRATIFTGCRPPTTQRYDNKPFFSEFRRRTGFVPATLPEAFRLAGYRTAALGFVYHDRVDSPSWSEGHSQVPEWADRDDGFGDVPERLRLGWRSREAKELIRERWERLAASGITPEALDDPAIERAARGPAIERFDGPDTAYPDGVTTEAAVDWIERRRRNQAGDLNPSSDATVDSPFFLALGFVSGHTPFRAPARDWDIYDRASLALPLYGEAPEGSPEWTAGDSEPSQFYTTDGYTKPWRADEAQARELLHGHYATISYTDRQIGRVLGALERANLTENTIVVITSDHGFHDGQHGYWGKHNLWEQSLQVPLLIRVPGRSGGTTSALTEHIDLFPTLCELAEIATPPHVEGDSFAHLFSNLDAEHKGAVFAHRRHMWHDRLQVYSEARSVRTARYRYTHYLDETGSSLYEELFDYRSDPEERRNLCLESPPPVIEELRSRLAALPPTPPPQEV